MTSFQNNNKKLPPAVHNYLRKHSTEKWTLELAVEKSFNNIIVVPAIQEYESIQQLIYSLLKNDPQHFNESLVIFVINNVESSSDETKNENYKTIEVLRNIISERGKLSIGLVDASSKDLELPEKDGGVGFARKIGMDLALKYFDYESKNKNILICLDADCTVDINYLTSIVNGFNKNNYKAAFVEYEHIMPENKNEQLAIICYELFLRYYVLGLKFAASPFSFPTIGSTMICDYESYINIGGMNKKKAAEDFYFMEKLAKITTIRKIDGTKVYPSSRPSWRVPFGTGQRVSRFLKSVQDEYVLYNPDSFCVLKDWLEIFDNKNIYLADEYLEKARSVHKSLYGFLKLNLFDNAWNKIINNSKSEEQIQKQKKIWFDGFRTLKLMHYLRDNGLPLVNMFDALDKYFELIGYKSNLINTHETPKLEIQLEYLKTLRNLS